MDDKLHKYLIMVYGALLVAGAALFMFDVPYAQCFFSVGAFLAVVQTFTYAMQHKDDTTGDKKTDIQQARLHRLNFVASLFLGIAAWMMWIDETSWVVFVLIYVVLTLYLSFRSK